MTPGRPLLVNVVGKPGALRPHGVLPGIRLREARLRRLCKWVILCPGAADPLRPLQRTEGLPKRRPRGNHLCFGSCHDSRLGLAAWLWDALRKPGKETHYLLL